uniref:WD repeat domain-containing protein 83 n=1 Tax=Steinernema glaseri TaxID=37863 RepID=A0A1I7ZJD4_9BILA
MSSAVLPTTLVSSFECQQGAVRAVRFNVDGKYCLSCGSDKSVKLWNPYKGTLLKSYTGSGSDVLDACSSPDNSIIASGGYDRVLTLHEVETGKISRRVRGHGAPINAVLFNEEGIAVLSASNDGTVRIFDIRQRSMDPVQILDEATDGILSLDVSDHEIATGSADGSVRVYDIRAGRVFIDYMGDSVTSVKLTNDRQCVVTSTMGGHIRMIEKINGKLLTEYTGHLHKEFKIDCAILSSDCEIVSGSEDGLIYIYDIVESNVLCRLGEDLKPRPRHVATLSSHPSRPCIAAATQSKMFIWDSLSADDL